MHNWTRVLSSAAALTVVLAGLVAVDVSTARMTHRSQASIGPEAGEYKSVTDTRVVDTRNAGQPLVKFTSTSQTQTMSFAGIDGGLIPSSGVLAVALNLTTVNSSGNNYLVAWKAGTTRPAVNTIEENSSVSVDNMTIVPVDQYGQVSFWQNLGSTDLLVDVVGFVTSQSTSSAQSTFVPTVATSAFANTNIGAGATAFLQVSGVPSGATSVALDLGTTSATANGYVLAWAADQPQPANVSSIDTKTGISVQRMLVVPVSSTGQIKIYNAAGSVTVFGNVQGYFLAPTAAGSGDVYVPVTQSRILSTSVGSGATTTVSVVGAGATGDTIPTGVDAVAVNVSAVNATANSYLIAYPNSSARPSVSTMDTSTGISQETMAFVQPGTDGRIAIYNFTGTVTVLVDVLGYFKKNLPPTTPYATLLTPPGTCATSGPGTRINTTTPQMSAAFSDPDGGSLSAYFTISLPATNQAVASSSAVPVSSGQNASWTPATGWASDGTGYYWQAYSFDGYGYSPSSAPCYFVVDLTAPATPTVSSTSYTENDWTDPAPGSNTFYFSDSSTDTSYVSYSIDNSAWHSDAGAGGSVSWAPTAGLHTFQVQAFDQAGNSSPIRTFQFGVGRPSMTVLLPQMASARYFPVTAAGPPGASTAYLQWKTTASTSWASVAGGSVAAGGGTWTGTVSQNGTGSVTPTITWDSTGVAASTTTPVSLDVRACFTYTGGPDSCSKAVTIQRLPHAFGGSFADAPTGPGQVALSTGEFQYSTTDTSVPGYHGALSLDRTALSQDGVSGRLGSFFGPGWTTTLPTPDAGALDATVDDHLTSGGTADGSIDLTSPDGGTDTYTDPNWNGSTDPQFGQSSITLNYQDEDGTTTTAANTDGSNLQLTTDELTLTLVDSDGTKTNWTRSSKTAGWQPSSVVQPGSQGTDTISNGSYASNPPVGAQSGDSWTSITSTATPAVSCVPVPVAGCRVLTVVTASATTTATPIPTDANPAAYPGQIREVLYSGYDPDAQAETTVQRAVYAYNSTGHLVSEYDPQADVTPGQHLVNNYAYDSLNPEPTYRDRLTSITPTGQAPWTFTYLPSSDAHHPGWLSQVSRHDATLSADDVTHVVYGVPLSGSGLPDLTSGTIASWGQPATDAPNAAAAVFPPDHTVSDTPGSTDWAYAHVSYLDALGRSTNTAGYGENGDSTSDWQIATTVYDANNRVSSTLTGANRAAAIASTCPTWIPALVCGQTSSANRATLLSTMNVYADQTNATDQTSPAYQPDGKDPALLVDTYGPAHTVTRSDGSVVTVRSHTHTIYDQGAPTPQTADKWRLPTTIAIGGYKLDGLADPTSLTAGSDIDTRTTTNGYNPIDGASNTDGTSGWVLGKPTVVTTDPNGLAITAKTRYNNNGNSVEQRQPTSNGADAGTTRTVYWTAGANADDSTCGNAPQWAGLTCTSGPAAQPAGTTIPTTRATAYSMLLAPHSVTDTSGSTTRTTMTSYDGAGRTLSVAISETGGPAGEQAVPTQTFTYYPSTGLQEDVTNGTTTDATTYDGFGRVISQTDGSGQTAATTTYDSDSRPMTVTDVGNKGATSYTYDGAGTGEHRGLATAVDFGIGNSIPSQMTVGYDANGAIAIQTFPNGVTQTRSTDSTGAVTEINYKDHAGASLADWTTTYAGSGQLATQNLNTNIPAAAHKRTQIYGYDTAGRLSQVNDTRDGVCTARTYTLDGDSNRTAQSAWVGAPTAACPATTGAATSGRTATYDTYDRITQASTTGTTPASGSYSYDTLARISTLPAVDATSGSESGDVALTYYSNDLASSETQGSTIRTFTLDANQRLNGWTDTSGTTTTTTTNHYDDNGDSPTWTDNGDGSWTRDLVGPDGNLALLVTGNSTGATSASLQILDPHGDVASTIADSTNVTAPTTPTFTDSDEFGIPLNANAPSYGWVGGKRRITDTSTGLVQMGVRLYNPAEGRFLQTDPIAGGSANNYDYADQDPINTFDLDGQSADHYYIDGGGYGGGGAIAVGLGLGTVAQGLWYAGSGMASGAYHSVASGASGAWSWVWHARKHRQHNTRKKAYESAKAKGNSEPELHGPHSGAWGGSPHYHPTKDGQKISGGGHDYFPKARY